MVETSTGSRRKARPQAARPAICFAGCLPPPVHGMANVNAQMVGRLSEHCPVTVFAVMQGDRSGIAGHAIKAARALRAVFGIVRSALSGAKVFYGSVDDKFGGLYTAAFAMTARICRMRVFLHHHSFYYVDRTTFFMRLVSRAAGPAASHIMLCECMGTKFAARYPAARKMLFAPNSVELPNNTKPEGKVTGDRPMVIGLLSNLSFQKGLDTFTELVERARSEGLDIKGVMAGPADGEEAREHIDRALALPGEAIEWAGPVAGEGKESFFENVDVFVFPTRYPTEAYPLVIVEALARGLPVISIDRGCIGELARPDACTVHPREADFVAATLPQLERFARDPAALARAKVLAAQAGRELNETNRIAGEQLLRTIVSAALADS